MARLASCVFQLLCCGLARGAVAAQLNSHASCLSESEHGVEVDAISTEQNTALIQCVSLLQTSFALQGHVQLDHNQTNEVSGALLIEPKARHENASAAVAKRAARVAQKRPRQSPGKLPGTLPGQLPGKQAKKVGRLANSHAKKVRKLVKSQALKHRDAAHRQQPTRRPPILGIFGRAHQHYHHTPVASGDSWPQMNVVMLELLLVGICLLLCQPSGLRQKLQMQSMLTGTTDANPPRQAVPLVGAAEPKLLHHRISVFARSNPHALALIDGDHRETFGELQAAALHVARHLVEERGVRPSSRTPVGVCAEGRAMMHAVLGIVHTGNPYVPLPPNLPSAQRDFIVADSKIGVVLADAPSLAPGGAWEGRAEASPAHVLTTVPPAAARELAWEVSECDLAYVLYTSGSTGKPKGVLAPHSAYHNRLKWMWDSYPLAEGEVGIQKTAIGWVDHVQEVFGFLGGGATLVLAPPETRANPVKLLDLCREHSVSRLVLVPSLMRVIVQAFGDKLAHELPCLRFWLLSGEPFPKDLLQAVLKSAAPGSTVLNTYGTTEVAGDVSWAAYDSNSVLPDSAVVPVGRAIPPNLIHLLDPDTLQHVPPGEPGEIFVEGPHLACGYHNRPEEDQTRFVELPGLGIRRAFRTGDFGKLDGDEMIQFLGRKDQQVKVHGQRVEILQIEHALGEALLEASPKGAKPPCAVMAAPSEKEPGSYRLFAFVESGDGSGFDEQKVRQHMLNSLLPAHIPESIAAIKALPRLVNGKLDRVALGKTAAEQAGKDRESGVAEEMDSFGQIRRILVEHMDGRRIIGTINTCSLFMVVVCHWLFNFELTEMNVGVAIPAWAASVPLLLHDLCDDSLLLLAGVGALHGMGDSARFKFSWLEPILFGCWFLIHVALSLTLPEDGYIGYLWFIPAFLSGRLWVLVWHQMLRVCGVKDNRTTGVLSILACCGYCVLTTTDLLAWSSPAVSSLRSYLPLYAQFDPVNWDVYKKVPGYLFGFYCAPGVIKSICSVHPALRFLIGLLLFASQTVFVQCFTTCKIRLCTSEHSTTALQSFDYIVYFTYIVSIWCFFSALPTWIDLTLPGPMQLSAYILHIYPTPFYLHGLRAFGVRLFPSMLDILAAASKAPFPVDGICQLMVMFGYCAGYFLVIIGLYPPVATLLSTGFGSLKKLAKNVR